MNTTNKWHDAETDQQTHTKTRKEMKSIRSICNQASRLLKNANGTRREYICKCTRTYIKRISAYLGIDMDYKEAETKYTHAELNCKFEEQTPRKIYAGY